MPALDSVAPENIQNYFRNAKNYMFGYLLGHVAGLDLEKLIKRYSNRIVELLTLIRTEKYFFCYKLSIDSKIHI